ncbi:glycosyltransferase [Maricaulaceae bacterium EIL42A08]|nr:glycosyltransferase [Maricaulaceae bacterium EIL42A08]
MNALSFAVAVPVGAWHPDLPKALASLSSQSVPLEVALLDASNDPRVIAAADACDLTFAYRRHGRDAGQAAAIAEGWSKTRSDIVGWLNADDRLTPGALAHVSSAFNKEPVTDIVYGGSDFVDAEGVRRGSHEQIADASALLLRSNIISQPSCFVRRAAVDAVGGLDEGLDYVMDWDLWLRLYNYGARFHRLADTLSEVYMGPGTKTAELNPKRLAEVFALVSRHAGLWGAFKSTLALSTETLAQRKEES